MGLKNTNYKINGYEYPQVYAVFANKIEKIGNDTIVYFNVHATRDLALIETPLEVKTVRLTDWDRKSDIVAYAYQKGKEIIKEKYVDYVNGGEKIISKDGPFTGWINDIVS